MLCPTSQRTHISASPTHLPAPASVHSRAGLRERLGVFEKFVVLVLFGDAPYETFVRARAVPKDDAFGSLKSVVGDVLGEGHRPLVEIPCDRLWCDGVAASPWVD